MSRREFKPPAQDGGAAPRARPSTAPALQRPKSALILNGSAEATYHLPAAVGITRRPSSAFPKQERAGAASPSASAAHTSSRPASALSTGRSAVASGYEKQRPLLPLHIDSNVFQSQKYAISNPAEVYTGMPLVEKDLETNLMVNYVLHGHVPAAPPPEMSMGFLEPKSLDGVAVQRKIAKCVRRAAALRARGEVEAALGQYTQMLKLHPHDYDVMCCLGTMLCRVGETAVAVKALSKACQCKPLSCVAWYNLGCAHMHHILRQPSKLAPELRTARALRAFDKCIEIAPISEAFAARAQCRRHAGDFLGATADYNMAKTAASAHAMSMQLAPQLHQAWAHGASLLASTIQARKDAENQREKQRRKDAEAEAERKQRVLKDLFVNPLRDAVVNAKDSSSDDDDSAKWNEGAGQRDAEWASDSSSSDEEGKAVAAFVEEDYLGQYASISSSKATSLDADVLLARSKVIAKLEKSTPGEASAAKALARLRDTSDSVVTLADHETKLASSSVRFKDVESPKSPSTAAPSFIPPSDTAKRFKARQHWHVCRQFMRVYGPVAIPFHRRTHYHTARIVEMIKRFDFLNKLPPYVLQQVAQCVRSRVFDSGDVIIRQGSAGTSLFIIMMGNVDVAVHFGEPKQAVLSLAKRVAGFAMGQAFGETAFTSAAPRSAFCVAASGVVAAELLKEDFDRIKKGE